MTSEPPRPDPVPATARWDADEKVFRAGPVDANGDKHGRWQAWYPSGRLYGEDDFAAGVAHGASWCARGEGDESPFDDTFDPRVARLERVHDRGMLMRDRCFTRDGALVGSNGEPWPERAGDIPEDASYLAASELWVDGPIDAAAPITGRQRLWYRDGKLVQDAEFRDGKKHGTTRIYHHGSVTVQSDLGGPPLTHLIEATYVDGELRSLACFERDGTDDTGRAVKPRPLATAQLVGGKLHGTVTWDIARMIYHHYPIVTIGARVLKGREMYGERQVRNTKWMEVEFADDAPVARRWFDAAGSELFPPPPVTDFGQGTTRDQLAGYLVRGDFTRDLATWFGDREASSIDEDANRALDVFGQLPEPHRAQAHALYDAIADGKVPWLETMSLNAYGFDPVKNDLYGAAEARYFGLAYDPSGNMQFLDLQTGEVVGYEHEEGIFDPRRAFPDLDSWAFTMLRVQLVAERRTAKDDVAALCKQLGLRAGLYELGVPADEP